MRIAEIFSPISHPPKTNVHWKRKLRRGKKKKRREKDNHHKTKKEQKDQTFQALCCILPHPPTKATASHLFPSFCVRKKGKRSTRIFPHFFLSFFLSLQSNPTWQHHVDTTAPVLRGVPRTNTAPTIKRRRKGLHCNLFFLFDKPKILKNVI